LLFGGGAWNGVRPPLGGSAPTPAAALPKSTG